MEKKTLEMNFKEVNKNETKYDSNLIKCDGYVHHLLCEKGESAASTITASRYDFYKNKPVFALKGKPLSNEKSNAILDMQSRIDEFLKGIKDERSIILPDLDRDTVILASYVKNILDKKGFTDIDTKINEEENSITVEFTVKGDK